MLNNAFKVVIETITKLLAFYKLAYSINFDKEDKLEITVYCVDEYKMLNKESFDSRTDSIAESWIKIWAEDDKQVRMTYQIECEYKSDVMAFGENINKFRLYKVVKDIRRAHEYYKNVKRRREAADYIDREYRYYLPGESSGIEPLI